MSPSSGDRRPPDRAKQKPENGAKRATPLRPPDLPSDPREQHQQHRRDSGHNHQFHAADRSASYYIGCKSFTTDVASPLKDQTERPVSFQLTPRTGDPC